MIMLLFPMYCIYIHNNTKLYKQKYCSIDKTLKIFVNFNYTMILQNMLEKNIQVTQKMAKIHII